MPLTFHQPFSYSLSCLSHRHYLGYLQDGTLFDDSYQRGQPIYFILGSEQVLKGW